MMETYFKPLRRKSGAVTLGLACLLMSGWVRSQFMGDVILLRAGKTWSVSFESNQGFIGSRAAAYGNDTAGVRVKWWPHSIDRDSPFNPMKDVYVDYMVDWPGFGCGCKGLDLSQKNYYAICFVFYPIVIIPLTLLSGWLLLSKTRQPKLKGDSLCQNRSGSD